MKKYVILFVCLFLTTSCEMFRYHPYEDVEGCETNLTCHNIDIIQRLGIGKDTLRFAFISDTQRRYDDTHDAINFINNIENIDFVLHGGDMTDFGVTFEFEWMYEELLRLKKPYLTVIGNHDFLGTGEHTYQHVFGTYNYSLNVGHLHIVALNTSSREQDYTIHVPDFVFLYNDIASVDSLNLIFPDSITNTVILMHARPGDEQFNNNVALPFAQYIHNYPGLKTTDPIFMQSDLECLRHSVTMHGIVTDDDLKAIEGSPMKGFCLNGHNHQHELFHALDDNTLFYGVPDIRKREIYIFTIHPNGYDFEMQTF